jgi:hypothetical protein
MSVRRTLLRGATVLSLAVAVVGTAALAPTVSASPLDDLSVAENAREVPGIGDLGIGDLGSGDGGIEDVPIIGDMVNTFKDAPPEEIVINSVQMAGAATESIAPLIRGFIR